MGYSYGDARLVARGQAVFRAVNERIEATNKHFGVALKQTDFVCECADRDCMDRLMLTLEKYEEVRRFPTHFIVATDHVDLDYEKVVERIHGYVVVEKIGQAGKEALKWDKRRALHNLQAPGPLVPMG
jgi:hypothetical protein